MFVSRSRGRTPIPCCPAGRRYRCVPPAGWTTLHEENPDMGDVRAPWTRRIAGLGLAAVAALAVAGVSAVPAAAEGQILGAGNPNAIKDSYLVMIKDSASPRAAAPQTAQALVAQYGGKVNVVWQDAVNGFGATMSEQQAKRLAADPRIVHVEQDATVSLAGTQTNPPSWGLDRIDQRDLPLNSTYTYPDVTNTVTAYVIDTGIRTTHTTFGGRAVWGTNTVAMATTPTAMATAPT